MNNMLNKSISLKWFYIKLMIMFISFFEVTYVNKIEQLPALGIYIIIISFVYVIQLHKNIFTIIPAFFILISNYSIVMANYFSDIESFFTSDANNAVSITGLKVICVFMTILITLYNEKNKQFDSNEKIEFTTVAIEKKEGHILIAVMYLFIIAFIAIFGILRPDTKGVRGSTSTLYEYSTIFFIVGFYYFSYINMYKKISLLLMLIIIIQDLFYGGRATAIQIALIIYIFYIQKSFKPNYKIIIPLAITGFLVLSGVGMFRANFQFSTNSILNIVKSLGEKNLTLDTAFSAYYTSLTFIKTKSILTYPERIHIFINWLFSIFLGGNAVANSNVAVITRRYFVHYAGGVLPFFGYFYFGYVGVILLAVVVSIYFNTMIQFNQKSVFYKCALLYVSISVPRWLLYSPSSLFRGVFLVAVLFYFTKFANKILLLNKYSKPIVDRKE